MRHTVRNSDKANLKLSMQCSIVREFVKANSKCLPMMILSIPTLWTVMKFCVNTVAKL